MRAESAAYTCRSFGFAPDPRMRRSTVRMFAFVILAVFTAPVAMHLITHDLHDHADEFRTLRYTAGNVHSNHEHPIVSSATPQTPSLLRGAIPVAVVRPMAFAWKGVTRAERNILALGALRMDDDVGLQKLLSTFLI